MGRFPSSLQLNNALFFFSFPTTTIWKQQQLRQPRIFYLSANNSDISLRYGNERREYSLSTLSTKCPSPNPMIIRDGDGCLSLGFHNGRVVALPLSSIPDNVHFTHLNSSDSSSSTAAAAAAFLGASSPNPSSRHVFKLGLIQFKIWWMIPRSGSCGSDIPVETQLLLLETRHHDSNANDTTSYILFLPALDGDFRSSLQGNSNNELEFCVESGDPALVTSQCLKAVLVNYGDNPFDLIKESMKILQMHLPGILDLFGWCTWDAFYTEVCPQGIKEGLESLSQGGTPARFLIIDDGWQDITNEFQQDGEPYVEGSQYGARLVSIKENGKFGITDGGPSDTPHNLKDFIQEIKRKYGLKYVYVWHALMGYWGGLDPDAPGMKQYNAKLRFPQQSPGNLANKNDIAMDCMEKYGVGTIDPAKISKFYDDVHKYIVSQGVDGVKVDVQNILETLAAGLGGRVSLTRHFQQALEKSIATNFQDNSIICCMGQSTDSVYHSKTSAITRASDDYYPRDPTAQTQHIAAVAFNSIFLGEVVVPDWDMFYSRHYAAELHAIARAVGGCAVYVSLLKIWNLNKLTGVIGVFNCQGAGIWPCMKTSAEQNAGVEIELSADVSPADIEYFEEVAGEIWTGDCAIFSFRIGSLSRLPEEKSFSVTLKSLECDVFTISPIKALFSGRVECAAIGLIDMYNSGGAVEAIDEYASSESLSIRGKGEGRFGAYSSARPKSCYLDSQQLDFSFRDEDNLLTVTIPMGTASWNMIISY
ncbi:Glycosyl hydrolases 36 [Dillenia turbinata]|uniref:galactinol--sucrose galactosyltransferase n=1 Tax=Dillenia turbinata TaxID=194707 RepID=A0AAN8ZAG1_9MAGN